MTVLGISLLGTVHVTHEGHASAERPYAKVLGLLAYLAVESDRPHQRAALADLFWPEQPEERARHSLRQALSTLRRMVGDDTAKPPHILIARDSIGFNRDSGYSLDVEVFDGLLRASELHGHQHLECCQPCIRRLEQAVALYRGDFLAGFSPGDSVGFDDWAQAQRQRLHQQALKALGAIGNYHEQRGSLELAIPAVQRRLELEPWDESAHRQVMGLLWKSGRRNESLAQYERCRRVLDDELGVEPEHETTDLYEHIRAAGPATHRASAVPARAIDVYRLPVPATRLVGRRQELEEIADTLTHRDCRMLTLIGPGGGGKTRLAIQTASDQGESFSDGARFVSLATVREREGVAAGIATELGLTMAGGDDPEQQLLDWLRDRSILLVLDNAEHLVHDMQLVPRMLAAGRGLKILVTSRERLLLHGEWIYEVGGLAVPAGDAAGNDEGYGAIELFGERLRQVRGRVPLRDEERALVVRICQLVEGMPLAIELAAAWAQSLSLDQIATEIRKNLDFLSTSMRDLPDRHRSIRAVFNQTWQMLGDEEQAAYRRLSMFRDGFQLQSAEAVAGTAAPLLAALVSKSLVVRLPTGRYRLHELLRHYGEEMLRRDEEEHRELQDRHCQYFLAFLADRQHALMGRAQHRALAEIDHDIGNIRAAWRWGIRTNMVQALGDAAHALWMFYVMRGWMREGATAFGRVVIAMESSSGASRGATPERNLTLAKALVRYGGFRSGLGRYDHGAALLNKGIALLRQHEAARELGLALNMLAAALRMKGSVEEARALLQESLAHFRTVNDAWGIAFSLNDLGLVSHLLGNQDEASRFCEESRVMFRRTGDRRGHAFAAFTLGMIASHDGDYGRAKRLHREALTLREETDDRWGIAASLVQLGFVARSVEARHDARVLLLKALDTAWNSSVTPVVLEALVEYAALLVDEGEIERAREIFVAVAAHPAVQSQAAERIAAMLADIAPHDAAPVPEMSPDRWAVQAVNDLARGLVG